MEPTIIQNKIYEIRGQRVMLDFDLAALYQVETRTLKQAVRRNIERFPEDFMFEFSEIEYNLLKDSLRSQFVTSNKGGIRYMPFAFTEQGVSMLSAVLKSPIAIQTSIAIMRAFVAMRQLLSSPVNSKVEQLSEEINKLKEYVEEVFADQNDINEDTRIQLELINRTLAELQVKNRSTPTRPIGFKRP